MKVKFNELNIGSVVFHQWDFGQTLEFDDVPDNSEAHFPVPDSSEMAVVKVIGNSCAVPDGTLTLNNETLKAYLFQKINGSGLTKKTIIIRIISRPQPEGYVYNPDDDKVLDYQELKDRVEAVVTAAENGEYDGADGQDGQDGADGEDGASAYEIAVDNGFVGTEQQWLASLKGDTGAAGAKGDKGDKGDKGEKGDPGETPIHNYSTTEQVVGTWIDGKPIYERTIYSASVSIQSGTWSNNVLGTHGTGIEIIRFDGFLELDDGRRTLNHYRDSSICCFSFICSDYDDINIRCCLAGSSVESLIVTIQYTKNSD